MNVASFDRQVYVLVRRIPRGSVASYGQVAALLGKPRAARAVGGAMRRCPANVPWHRVLNAAGRISRRKRAASMLTQRMMLEREGVTSTRGRVDFAKFGWNYANDAVRGRAKQLTARVRSRLKVDDAKAWEA
jgi:methylated-DNA-protein-cysteine methyltransferase-like protein